MSAVQAANAAVQSVGESNAALNWAAAGLRQAIAALVTAQDSTGKGAQAFMQAASMVTSNSSSEGHMLSRRASNQAQSLKEMQARLVAALEPITTLLQRTNELVNDGEAYRNRLTK